MPPPKRLPASRIAAEEAHAAVAVRRRLDAIVHGEGDHHINSRRAAAAGVIRSSGIDQREAGHIRRLGLGTPKCDESRDQEGDNSSDVGRSDNGHRLIQSKHLN